MIYQIIIEKGELVMTAKESGMEEYIAYVSELYKMPFSISDIPQKKKDYHRKKRLGKKKSSDLLYSNDAYINDGSGNPGHQGMPSILIYSSATK